MESVMNTIKKVLLLMVGLGVCATANATTESSERDSSEIERIEVIGELTLSGYKQQIIVAKKDFYALYNQLTDNAELKVKCQKQKISGSNRRKEVCHSVYESNVGNYAFSKNPQKSDILQIMDGSLDGIKQKKLDAYQQKHLENMRHLVNSNDELKQLFFDYTNLREKYHAKRLAQISAR